MCIRDRHESSISGLRIEGTVQDPSVSTMEKYECCASSSYISGTKYIDYNCDGITAWGNNITLPDHVGEGWVITLYNDQGQPVATTTTDVNGYYTFEIDDYLLSLNPSGD